MALIELKMPALGEGIIEATVLKWLKQVGDTVEEEEMVLEIATDKVDSEVPSTVAGVIKELLFKENDVAPVGATIALIEGSSDSEPAAPKPMSTAVEKPAVEPDSEEAVPYVPIAQNPALQNHESSDSTRPGTIPGAPILSQRNADPGEEGDEEESTQDSGNNGFFSPLVLSIAQKEGISMEQLGGIQGTGGEGRLT
ncbi:MAG TPA: biotin/lipoyl-containing protein, partial [Arachidicoccus sp.]|nr:biotin/lipoyl-containing protein [Arachidicoccus sp.]